MFRELANTVPLSQSLLQSTYSEQHRWERVRVRVKLWPESAPLTPTLSPRSDDRSMRCNSAGGGRGGTFAGSSHSSRRNSALISVRFQLVFLILALTESLARGQGYPPQEAARHMTVPAGFQVELTASEPAVRQPVAIDFDERGRLWVMQYLQYPNPAGLKRVKVDRFSRTVYDRVPEPPPRGPKGADRLTILSSDRKTMRDFVGGLNLASGFAFGRGGVFVLQVPYLLFYPDHDRNDVPDSDPEVLLTGFGMEDAHSVANSLTWGPDGWLYGCQGSTVTANIRGIEFQQGVWRYHPESKRFELFCEGGGNSWGLDFDRHGNLLYSTNFGPYVMLHGVEGGYYWKQFGKHGALHNPFAYGYFDHVPHQNFAGGHVTAGGTLYQADQFPPEFRGTYIAADLLGHAVRWSTLTPQGSSFRSRHAGALLTGNDTWFAPCDVTLGPDGCIYVADWHDARTAHPDPDAEWDRSNGRVFRISYGKAPVLANFDLASKTSAELVELLDHPNVWYVNTARRLLADRRDQSIVPVLKKRLEQGLDQRSLEMLWAIHVSGGFNAAVARACLQHRNPDVRRWTVRFIGDDEMDASGLEALAATEDDVHVRSQLASTARRLPAAMGLAIVRRLILRDLDEKDPHIPLLLWWAVERHADAQLPELARFLSSPEAWRSSLANRVIRPRLVRRSAALGQDAAVVELLASAPSSKERVPLAEALEAGLEERPTAKRTVDGRLIELVRQWRREQPMEAAFVRTAVRVGDAEARQAALAVAMDPAKASAVRLGMIRVLGESREPAIANKLAGLLGTAESAPIQRAALEAWSRAGDPRTGTALLALYERLPVPVRSAAVTILLSRKDWAKLLMDAVENGRIQAKDVTVDDLHAVALHKDPQLNERVRKLWGNVGPATPEEKLAEIRRLNNDLRAAAGDPRAGQALFKQHCATCHRLFNEGETTGPDLTHANRADRAFLLASLIDPSAVVRKEYLAYILQMKNGQVHTGIIVDQNPQQITIATAKNEKLRLLRSDIEEMKESPVSLMPENLLRDLRPQQVRDLFAYLQQPWGK